MKRRIALVGLSLLCVSVVTVVPVQGAAAVSLKGRTCVGVAKKPGEVTLGYEKAKCKGTPTTDGGKVISEWALPWAFGLKTIMGVAAPTTKVKATIAGVALELQSSEATGSGTILNEEAAESFARGTATIAFKGVTVTAPAGKGCEVSGGAFSTKELKFTTSGQAMFVKFEPASGTLFATVKVQGCSISALNNEYKVEGSTKGVPSENGEVVFSHAETTEQATLKLGGQKAGFEGALTLEGREESKEEELKVIGFTT